MNFFLFLVAILPFCQGIDIQFHSTYSNGIKRIEVPSCREEPCALIKGQPLKVKVTFESTYPKGLTQFTKATDAKARIFLDGYRNRYNLDLTNINSFCKNQPSDCPLVLHKNYTLEASLFLSADTAADQHTAFGSENGKTDVMFNVILLETTTVGTVIADVATVFDIQAAH